MWAMEALSLVNFYLDQDLQSLTDSNTGFRQIWIRSTLDWLVATRAAFSTGFCDMPAACFSTH